LTAAREAKAAGNLGVGEVVELGEDVDVVVGAPRGRLQEVARGGQGDNEGGAESPDERGSTQ
jgi:hypothetical protein